MHLRCLPFSQVVEDWKIECKKNKKAYQHLYDDGNNGGFLMTRRLVMMILLVRSSSLSLNWTLVFSLLSTGSTLANLVFLKFTWDARKHFVCDFNGYWWSQNVHQWDTRSLRSDDRCLKIRKHKEKPSKGGGPVWSRPNTLRRFSQKTLLQL